MSAATFNSISTYMRLRIMKVAPELQFWGYESGNMLAAIAGAGGFFMFYSDIASVITSSQLATGEKIAVLFSNNPDAAAPIGLAVIILVSMGLGSIAGRLKLLRARTSIDAAATLLGMTLIATTLYFGASWITVSAVCFVSGSTLLRLCCKSPVFLKLGGLMLALGGVCLAIFGATSFSLSQSILLAGLTSLTGIYVVAASLMTYQGGIFECQAIQSQWSSRVGRSGLFDPGGRINGLLETYMDGPIGFLVKSAASPAVFWVPNTVKDTAPLLTSMWARLPWRVLTAMAAIATGTAEGFVFALANLCWSVGDVSIGSLDWGRAQPAIASVDAETNVALNWLPSLVEKRRT